MYSVWDKSYFTNSELFAKYLRIGGANLQLTSTWRGLPQNHRNVMLHTPFLCLNSTLFAGYTPRNFQVRNL
jgi:hypothetical protein